MYDKKYKLRYLPLFYEDLNEKITYIVEKLKKPKAASDLLDKVEKAILERKYSCYRILLFKGQWRKNKDYVRPIPDSIINPVSSRCSIIWDCYKLNSLVEFKNEKGL